MGDQDEDADEAGAGDEEGSGGGGKEEGVGGAGVDERDGVRGGTPEEEEEEIGMGRRNDVVKAGEDGEPATAAPPGPVAPPGVPLFSLIPPLLRACVVSM